MNDELGDRIKKYEAIEKDKFMSYLPLYARIDGRNFSKYTKAFKKPFDNLLNKNMVETTKALVKEFKADLGYTQSDEISLFWFNEGIEANQMMFGGVKAKMNSVLAGYTSSTFMKNTYELGFPNTGRIPHFDSRIMQIPNKIELYNILLWRQKDCFRNAITCVSADLFSHKQIQGVSTRDKIDMIIKSVDRENLIECIEAKYLYGTFATRSIYENKDGLTRSKIISFTMTEMINDTIKTIESWDNENCDYSYTQALRDIINLPTMGYNGVNTDG